MTSEVVEVIEVNYLEVTEELFIYGVVPENSSFHDLYAKSNFFTCGLKSDLGGQGGSWLRPEIASFTTSRMQR